MRISDWSSDVCSSDLKNSGGMFNQLILLHWKYFDDSTPYNQGSVGWYVSRVTDVNQADRVAKAIDAISANSDHETRTQRSEEHTSELQSLMRISYAVLCLTKKTSRDTTSKQHKHQTRE